MTDEYNAAYQSFREQVNGSPEDGTLLLVFADWCGEHAKPGVEFALRWMIAAGKRPVLRPDVKRRPWSWHSDDCRNEIGRRIRKNAPFCTLPAWMFALVGAADGEWVEFPDAFTAVLWLADRLTTLREFLGVAADTVPEA
jgi:hypothetical protein